MEPIITLEKFSQFNEQLENGQTEFGIECDSSIAVATVNQNASEFPLLSSSGRIVERVIIFKGDDYLRIVLISRFRDFLSNTEYLSMFFDDSGRLNSAIKHTVDTFGIEQSRSYEDITSHMGYLLESLKLLNTIGRVVSTPVQQ